MTLWEEDVRLPSGHVIHGYLRSVERDYAMVFAMLDDGTVPLVRQYKHGKGALSYDLPAGYLDAPDEEPLAAAQRELREETGLAATRWRALGHLTVNTNRSSSQAHLYLALDVRKVGHQELDDTEALEVSFHTPADLSRMVFDGEIDSIGSVAGIMMALPCLGIQESPEAAK
jgi:ADP-ribose pyrophosphatase